MTLVLHRKSVPYKVRHHLLGDCVALLSALALFTLLLLVTARPLMAVILALLVVLAFFSVNKAKIDTLDEPLVFTDLPLFMEIFRVPVFYLPFLPWRYIVPTVLVGSIALVGLWNNSPREAFSWPWLAGLTAPLAVAGLLSVASAETLKFFFDTYFPLEFDPAEDIRKYGPMGAAFLHCVWHWKVKRQSGFGILNQTSIPPRELFWRADILNKPKAAPDDLPNIFLVQSESFADLRQFSPYIPTDILANYDAISKQGVGGQFALKYHGANTMRTEFAILTGATTEWLTTDSFNPYLTARHVRTWSLAFLLKKWGYKVVCVHPFYPEFFNRHRVIPNLGFDAFISLKEFSRQDCYGPYVSDGAVANKMISLLGDGKPVFCFAITMENHGPWRHDRFNNMQVSDSAYEALDAHTRRYLVHLEHADNMLGQLVDALSQQKRPGVLGWYGDHLPNLPIISAGAMNPPCLLWSSHAGACTALREEIGGGITSLEPSKFGGHLLALAQYSIQSGPKGFRHREL